MGIGQLTLQAVNDEARRPTKLASWRVVIGEVAEELAAAVLGAERQHTGMGHYCSDLKAAGVSYEVKSVGRTRRVLIYHHRLAKDREYAKTHPLVYVLVIHRLQIPLSSAAEARALMEWAQVWAVPFCYVDGVCAVSRPRRFNRKYSENHGSCRPGYEIGGYEIRADALTPHGTRLR